MSRWVVDTSPLVFLAKLDRLGLLRQGADELLMPRAVWREIEVWDDEAAARIGGAVEQGWLDLRPDVSAREPMPEAARGIGEIEVLLLAERVQADRVVLDDLNARREARRRGLALIGTLGLLLAARLRGEIPSLHEEIRRLQELGFWASPSLVDAVLRRAGEHLGPS